MCSFFITRRNTARKDIYLWFNYKIELELISVNWKGNYVDDTGDGGTRGDIGGGPFSMPCGVTFVSKQYELNVK